MADVFGKALQDYQKDQYTEDIKTYSSLDEEDVIRAALAESDRDA